MTISPEQLLAEVTDVIRVMPEVENMYGIPPEVSDWLGRAQAVLNKWDSIMAVPAATYIGKIHSNSTSYMKDGHRELLTLLNRAKYDLGLNTGQLTTVIEQGKVFDFFDQVRKIIETAQEELFFVDRYLDADFVARYMPHVKKGVKVRLLGRNKITALASAAKMFQQQENLHIEVKSSPDHHDRFVFIDRHQGYHTGGSFKDGAKNPAVLIPLHDIFSSTFSTYEKMWNEGSPTEQLSNAEAQS